MFSQEELETIAERARELGDCPGTNRYWKLKFQRLEEAAFDLAAYFARSTLIIPDDMPETAPPELAGMV